jgi:hypothetical protein
MMKGCEDDVIAPELIAMLITLFWAAMTWHNSLEGTQFIWESMYGDGTNV